MNIHLKREAAHSAVKPLAGKMSVVTGSTSGIGLGIARAWASLVSGAATVVWLAAQWDSNPSLREFPGNREFYRVCIFRLPGACFVTRNCCAVGSLCTGIS